MSTPKQIVAAKKTVENLRKPKPRPIGVVLVESGYSIPVSKHPSEVTRSKGYQEALQPLLKKHNITTDRYIKVISDAMDATKIVTSHTEPDYDIPDHAIRLSAAKQAKDLLNITPATEDTPSMNNQVLTKAMNDNMDEIELQRIVFSKSKQ